MLVGRHRLLSPEIDPVKCQDKKGRIYTLDHNYRCFERRTTIRSNEDIKWYWIPARMFFSLRVIGNIKAPAILFSDSRMAGHGPVQPKKRFEDAVCAWLRAQLLWPEDTIYEFTHEFLHMKSYTWIHSWIRIWIFTYEFVFEFSYMNSYTNSSSNFIYK